MQFHLKRNRNKLEQHIETKMSLIGLLINPFTETLLIILVTAWIIKKKLRHINLPPGPKGIPILGYLPFINEQTIHQDLMDMSEKYQSKLIHMKLGFDDVVM